MAVPFKQISFSDPIGAEFHALINEKVEQDKLNNPNIDPVILFRRNSRDMLLAGLQIVKSRGKIENIERKALLLEKKYSGNGSTTITYCTNKTVDDAVSSCINSSTLNGKRKVLKEAIVEALQKEGRVARS